MYAIIETGGKQYRVKKGDTIKVEKLDVNAGESHVFENVLMVGNEGDVKLGAPYVNGANVTASVLGDGKAKKVIVYKYKAKKGYHKKKGHRQPFTSLRIEAING